MTTTLEEQVALLTKTPTPEKQPLRVALVGAAGTGKTTHAKLLQKKYKGDVLSFATPLKKVCQLIFGEKMSDPQFAREALQIVGTDAIRKLDPLAWIRLLVEKVGDTRNCFIDDCRFPNEYYALRQLGFTFVRLDAYPQTLHRRRPTLTEAQANHESEQAIAFFRVDATLRTDPSSALQHFQEEFVATHSEDTAQPSLATALAQVEDSEEDIQAVHERLVYRLRALGVVA